MHDVVAINEDHLKDGTHNLLLMNIAYKTHNLLLMYMNYALIIFPLNHMSDLVSTQTQHFNEFIFFKPDKICIHLLIFSKFCNYLLNS